MTAAWPRLKKSQQVWFIGGNLESPETNKQSRGNWCNWSESSGAFCSLLKRRKSGRSGRKMNFKMPGKDYLIDDFLLCSNCHGSAPFRVLKIGIMRLKDKRRRVQGERWENGAKKDEKQKLVLWFTLCTLHYKVYFCVSCSGTFVVNTLLRELLFLYNYWNYGLWI